MAYTKTQWVNNTTPINDTNLNKIEQGIYDNSLVVDAIANTLNPTDTETYKTAELTEGQITDVIGVNDIVIKGQTSQDGTPTPSAPVDVNVISGSNVINISSKNLFDKDTKDFSKGYYVNNNGVEPAGAKWGVYYIRVEPNEVYSISGCQANGGVGFGWFNKNKTFISYIGQKQNRNNMIAPNNAYYLGLSLVWNITDSAYDNNIMLEKNSTATAYEPHQGKELPLDLGSIELCKIGNYQDYFYKSGSKWYLHKEIGKTIFNGSETWTYSSSNAVFYTDALTLSQTNSNLFCDRFSKVANTTTYANMNTGEIKYDGVGNRRIIIKYTDVTSAADLKTWLASNNTRVYYPLETATDTEITDTTLISQLEAIYNAPLYEQTNITQTNNDLPMILDITACKDNINGIKAFIRK